MTRKPSVPERVRRQVQERAQGRCEYCLIHESNDGVAIFASMALELKALPQVDVLLPLFFISTILNV